MNLYEEALWYDKQVSYMAKTKGLLWFCIAIGVVILAFTGICLIAKGYGGV